MRKYGPLIIFATIFFIVANIFKPADPNAAGIAILKALGMMLAIGIGIILIFLYAPKVGLPSLPSLSAKLTPQRREIVGTLTLFALFLITFSYAFGDSWSRVFGWWWNSQMAIPLIFAVIGVILFANCEWRKRINKGMITLIGILIAGTLAINALIGWWEGGEKASHPAIAHHTPAPSIPQPVAVTVPEPPKPREESVEREVIGRFGAFKEVELPPMERLVGLDFTYSARDRDDCLVAIVYDDAPDGKIFLCREVPSEGIVQKNVTRVGISSARIDRDVPVTVTIIHVPSLV